MCVFVHACLCACVRAQTFVSKHTFNRQASPPKEFLSSLSESLAIISVNILLNGPVINANSRCFQLLLTFEVLGEWESSGKAAAGQFQERYGQNWQDRQQDLSAQHKESP